eukprot:scaffold334_cov241-Pinguiococcus_pyrenoidosus.AAC.69
MDTRCVRLGLGEHGARMDFKKKHESVGLLQGWRLGLQSQECAVASPRLWQRWSFSSGSLGNPSSKRDVFKAKPPPPRKAEGFGYEGGNSYCLLEDKHHHEAGVLLLKKSHQAMASVVTAK